MYTSSLNDDSLLFCRFPLQLFQTPLMPHQSLVWFYHFMTLFFAFHYAYHWPEIWKHTERILSTSLHTACMQAKRQGECSLNWYKHCRSFPSRVRVSYHLEAVVVMLMGDLFIRTGKSQISMVTLGCITRVRLRQKCHKLLYCRKPLSSHGGWNLPLTLLFPSGQESSKGGLLLLSALIPLQSTKWL